MYLATVIDITHALLLVGVNNFCFQLGNVILVLLATQTLHLSTRRRGLLLAGGAVGQRSAAWSVPGSSRGRGAAHSGPRRTKPELAGNAGAPLVRCSVAGVGRRVTVT